MRRVVIAFAVGACVLVLVELVTVFGLGVLADAYRWPPFELRLGRLLLIEHERAPGVSTVVGGPGLMLLALVGAAANAAAAAALGRRV